MKLEHGVSTRKRCRYYPAELSALKQYVYDTTELQAPRPNQSVYREDCTQCFDSIASTLDMLSEFDLTSTRTIRLASMYASTASTAGALLSAATLSSMCQAALTLSFLTSSEPVSKSLVTQNLQRK